MPDMTSTPRKHHSPTSIAWLGGVASDIEALAATAGPLRRFSLTSASMARAVALRLAREHDGLAIVEASCPAFMAVCGILGRAPSIQLVTLHPAMRCMDAITIPPAMYV